MIVGLAGYAGAGKDTAAKCLVERGWRQDAFAAPLKAMALDINPYVETADARGTWHRELAGLVETDGWERAKRWTEVREFLQNLGAAVRTHLGGDVWVRAMADRLAKARAEYRQEPELTRVRNPLRLVVTDVRYENEAAWVLRRTSMARPKLIWIDRPGVGPVNEHPSDQGLVRSLCTHEVVNDGTPEQLWERILEVVA